MDNGKLIWRIKARESHPLNSSYFYFNFRSQPLDLDSSCYSLLFILIFSFYPLCPRQHSRHVTHINQEITQMNFPLLGVSSRFILSFFFSFSSTFICHFHMRNIHRNKRRKREENFPCGKCLSCHLSN